MLPPVKVGQLWQCRDQSTLAVVREVQADKFFVAWMNSGRSNAYVTQTDAVPFTLVPGNRDGYPTAHGAQYTLINLLWDPDGIT